MRPPRPIRTRRLTAAAGILLSTVAVLALTAPAGAHVQSSEEPVAAGGRTPVTFSFDHGCNGQPTTYLRVQIPPGVTDVVPEDQPGWTSTVSGDELRWDGGSIPDGQTASFVAVMTIDQPEGTVVRFPTIQGCPTAESAWIEVADATNPDPAYPAPQIVVGVAADAALPAEPRESDAGAVTTTGPTTTRVPLQETPITSQGSEQSSAGLVVFLVVVIVIAGGATILFLRNRRPS
jgi:uncharacterized protein YcnI